MQPRRRVRLRAFLALPLALVLWTEACGHLGIGSRSKEVTMNLLGADDQNAGTNGRPNSIVVRVYQLSARTNFDRASPASLWRDDAGALGNELLAKREVTLVPSANEKVTVSLVEQARFVAVAADFFNPDPNNWRGIVPVVAVKKKVEVHVGKTGLTVQ